MFEGRSSWAVEFLRHLHRGRGLSETLQVVLRHALGLVPAAQSGTVLLLDEETGTFRFAAAEGWDLPALARIALPKDRLIQSRLPLDRPSIIREPLSHNVAFLGKELAEALAALGPVAAILSAPVTDGTELVGVVNLDSRDDPDAFSKADLRRLEEAWEEIALAVVAARGQAKLREQEELLQRLFTRLSEEVLLLAPDGRILAANPAAARQTGYRQDELRGMNFTELLASAPPLSPGDLLRHLEGEAPPWEAEIRRKDGTTLWAEWVVAAVEHRGAPALLAVGRDITERKRREGEQAAHVAALEALARAAPGIAAAREPREAVQRIVAVAREITGADHANVLLFSPKGELIEVFDPYGAPKIPVQIRKSGFSRLILRTRQPLVVDDIAPDGKTTPPVVDEGTPLSASRILVQEGIRSLVGIPVSVGENLSAILYVHSRRPRALRPHVPVLALLAAQAGVALENALLYEELQRASARHRALFDWSPVALWIKDFSAVKARLEALHREGIEDLRAHLARHPGLAQDLFRRVRVEAANRAALDLLGTASTEELALHLGEVLSESGWAFWVEVLEALWAGRTAHGGEVVLRTRQGEPRQVRVAGQVLPGHEATWDRVLISAVDLTARVRAERALARQGAILQAAATAAERLLRGPAGEDAIPQVLAALGEAAGGSRVYLFEEHRDAQGRTVVSQRYEWVAPGITPQRDNPQLQSFPYVDAGYARWAEAFARGEAIHGVVREFPPEEQPLLQAQDIRAIAVVPVRVHGRRWGVLGFDDCVEERRWSTGEIEALRVAAETLGAAIERAELEQKLHRRQRELEALVKIATTLGERLEREAVFARVHEALAQLIPGDAFSLALVDSQKGEIRLAYGVEEGRRLPEVVVPFDPARSLSAWVAATRSPLLIRDAKAELEELPASPQQIGRFARSFLGVPLVVEEEVVGVLSVQSFAPGAYTADHLTLLQAAAAPIAVAVRNAQLFADRKQLEDKLRAVEEASRRMKLASDRETLYQIALDLARDVLGHSPCALLVPEGEELVVVAEHGELAWARGMRLRLDGPGITVAAFRSREPLYVPDVRQDPRYVASHPETKSELAHPLLVGDQVLGVFDVNSSRVDGIPPEDRDLLGIVASELAVALAGLAHLQGLEDLSGKLARLHEASLALSRASTAEEVCEAAVRAVAEVLGFDHANIGLGRGDLLVPVAGAGVLAGRARPFQRGEGIAGRVWERGETLWGNIEDFPFARPVSPEIRAFVAVPIGSRGVLQVIAPRRDAFTRNDVQLVRILARHVEEELRRVELEGELREQAIRDPLTGLYNRRFLTEVLGRELERAKRYGHPLTLVLADIDDFKKVNDRHGHGVGDRVLRRVAELLQTNVRAGDYVFRYGGEEFVVLLPETGDGGGEVVRRLRDLLSGVTVEGLPELRVSVSLGHVVWAPAEGPVTPEELLHRADAVLYAIKRARGGR